MDHFEGHAIELSTALGCGSRREFAIVIWAMHNKLRNLLSWCRSWQDVIHSQLMTSSEQTL